MANLAPETEVPMLSRRSPSCNDSADDIPWPHPVADIVSDVPLLQAPPEQVHLPVVVGLACNSLEHRDAQPSTRENEEDLEGADIEQANPTTYSLTPLLTREAESCEYTDDKTFCFRWKISRWSPVVKVGTSRYYKHTVLVPKVEIYENGVYEKQEDPDFRYWGQRLYTDKEFREWYEHGINEEIGEDEVWEGDDGQKYHKNTQRFKMLLVGSTREVVTINNVQHIAYFVLTYLGDPEDFDGMRSVAISPDGTRLASSASSDNTARIWNIVTGALLLTLKCHTAEVFSVKFSPDGTKVASASNDGTLHISDAVTGALLSTLKGASSVAFSPDGTKLASAYNKTLDIWDTATGVLLWTRESRINYECPVVFSPDGTKLAFASYETLIILDAVTGTLLQTQERVYMVAFSPDGTKLALASFGKTLNILDAVTGTLLQTLESHTDYVRSIVFSPDSKLLALASHEAVQLWDCMKYAELQTLEESSRNSVLGTETMTFSSNSNELLSASLDMRIRRWNTGTGLLLSMAEVSEEHQRSLYWNI
ncbi:hypothetical protein V500_00746 [Pseudogymnoascus sp. VKM F-4518 (FW-2643)]|nr:hypothetical protein V500_00746 [Pseudogymnoascus sp. VKM F-4518 (FW-2643)]